MSIVSSELLSHYSKGHSFKLTDVDGLIPGCVYTLQVAAAGLGMNTPYSLPITFTYPLEVGSEDTSNQLNTSQQEANDSPISSEWEDEEDIMESRWESLTLKEVNDCKVCLCNFFINYASDLIARSHHLKLPLSLVS